MSSKRSVLKSHIEELVVVVSLLAVTVSVFSFVFDIQEERLSSLEGQLQDVDEALGDLRSLERILSTIRSDMQQMANEKARIEREYEAVQGLQDLTDAQLGLLRAALNRRSIWSRVQDVVWAFSLGLLTSFLGQWIWQWWRRRSRSEESAEG